MSKPQNPCVDHEHEPPKEAEVSPLLFMPHRSVVSSNLIATAACEAQNLQEGDLVLIKPSAQSVADFALMTAGQGSERFNQPSLCVLLKNAVLLTDESRVALFYLDLKWAAEGAIDIPADTMITIYRLDMTPPAF